MRRMYSKEQLQKLIDEVSRLIAIEELDKVVPVPSLDKAGYVMQVNEIGTGYKLVSIGEAIEVKPIYCHPIQIDLHSSGNQDGKITMLIFNNSATPFTKSTFITWLQNLYAEVGETIRIMISGGFNSNNTTCIASYLAKTSSNPIILVGWSVDGNEVNRSYASNTDFSNDILNFNDGVNKIN